MLFNTINLQDSLAALRRDGFPHLGDYHVARLSPPLLDHVNVYGSLTFDVEHELGQAAHRPGLKARRTMADDRFRRRKGMGRCWMGRTR